MSVKTNQGQSGGVNISGMIGTVGGSIVGGDQLNQALPAALAAALHPLAVAIEAVPLEVQPEAKAKLSAIQRELARGERADDGTLARLIDGLVGLAPSAATAVIGIFATPSWPASPARSPPMPSTSYAADNHRW